MTLVHPITFPVRVRRGLLAAGLAAARTGCSVKTFAVNRVGDALSAPGPSVFTTDDDPELIRAALPFSLKMVESLLQTSPTVSRKMLTVLGGRLRDAHERNRALAGPTTV